MREWRLGAKRRAAATHLLADILKVKARSVAHHLHLFQGIEGLCAAARLLVHLMDNAHNAPQEGAARSL